MPRKGGARQATQVIATSTTNPNDIKTFVSLGEAARAFNVSGHNAVQKILEKGEILNGYRLSSQKLTTAVTPNPPKTLIELFDYDAHYIRVVPDTSQVSVVDILKVVTNSSNAHVWIARYPEIFTFHKFAGSGQRATPVVQLHGVHDLIKKIIANCRLSTSKIRDWAKRIGCTETDIIMYRKGATECDLLEIIEKVFSRYCTCITQYIVGNYRIDMYLKEYNIAIECDEYGHRHYNQQDEARRTLAIKSALHCNFVRFNPYERNFNIGDVIADINAIIDTLHNHPITLKHLEIKKLKLEKEKLVLENEKLRMLLELKRLGVDPNEC